MTTCEKCHRPIWDGDANVGPATCVGRASCAEYVEGRRAGMREALSVAKQLVRDDCSEGCGTAYGDEMDWSDVDAEIARRLGE